MTKKPTLLGGIKAKLISATCMLLVAVIMVVSSTYAWFTLSTAPEVTGITTAVGANGALEMLLATHDGTDWVYGTGTIDTNAAKTIRNTYWGNLVDLDDTAYGLEQIVLYPSQLNLAEGNTNAIAENAFLQIPEYGTDGRVFALSSDTVEGIFDPVDGVFYPTDEHDFGVRAVGSASGMTPRQLAYRNAVAAVSSNMRQAQQIAAASLDANGGDIANIAMKHATAKTEGSDQYGTDDVDDLLAVVTELKKSTDLIEKAYKQALLAYSASSAITGDDAETAYTVVQGYIDAKQTLTQLIASVKALTSLTTLPGEDYMTKLATTQANIAAAETGLNTARETTGATKTEGIAWGAISTPLQKLVDTSKMDLNGYSISEVKANLGEIASSVLSQGGLQLKIYSGGGVYADVADHCGEYEASIIIEEVEYNGMVLKNTPARMKTISRYWVWADDVPEADQKETNEGNADYGEYNPLTAYLTTVYNLVSGKKPEASTTVKLPMTEFYGYIIDMAFQTNAAESNLLLQIEGVDRIYDDNNNEETMGHGSSMTFAATEDSYSTEQMKNLMKCIRIVFFDTTGKNILATAKLDVDNATYGTEGWTAYMYLYKMATTTTPTKDANGNYMKKDAPNDVLYYYNSDDQKYYEDQAFTTVATVDLTLVASTTSSELVETKLDQEDSVITALTQNAPAHISALVYLDGTTIGNKDVSIGESSMTGKMNLQFSSSANLVPMEYADLHTSTAIENGTLSIDMKTATTGSAATTGAATYTSSNTDVCEVAADGTVTAKTVGTAKVVAKDADGKTVKIWSVTITNTTNP